MADKRTTNRRAFLQGKSAVGALADAAQALVPDPQPLDDPPSAAGSEGYLLQFSRRAMACQFAIYLNAGQYSQGNEAACAALDLVEQLEAQLTIFRSSSEISHINRVAAEEAIVVEERLFQFLEQAAELSRQTIGAFDITAGPLARLWGFVDRQGMLPAPDAIRQALERVGSDAIELNAGERSVRFRRPGIEINLGAIGKGYALDRAAELMTAAGIGDLLLHGGNSSVLARGGTSGTDWTVGLRNPLRPQQYVGQIHLCDQALATSGSGTQFFVHEGKRYGHILDPRTGWPAEGVLSATAIAPSAAAADALSTAFYVLGPVEARTFCEAHPEFGCVLLRPGDRQQPLAIHVAGSAIEAFRPA